MTQQYNPNRGFSLLPPVLKNLLIINVIMYLATRIFPFDLRQILCLYDWHSPYFRPWQLITHMFMHENLTHIFFNMFMLWMFGAVVENTLGSKRFVIYYLICGLGAAALQMFVQDWEAKQLLQQMFGTTDVNAVYHTQPLAWRYSQNNPFNSAMLGASGAIMGVVFAFGYLFPNAMVLFWFIPMKAKYWVAIMALIDIIPGIISSPGDNVAHFAHLVGMIVGWILLFIWKKKSSNVYLR